MTTSSSFEALDGSDRSSTLADLRPFLREDSPVDEALLTLSRLAVVFALSLALILVVGRPH